MTRFTLVRRGCGAAAILFAGLSAGCRHQSHRDCGCKEAITCANAATTPKAVVETKKSEAPLPPPPVIAEKNAEPAAPLPTRNERYVTPLAPRPPMLPAPAPLPETPTTVAPPKPVLTPPPADALKTDDTVRIPPVAGTAYKATRRSFPDITARAEFGRSPDYCVLTGELSFIPQKKQWRLRFASIDEEDRYGGSVTLDAGREMHEFRSGDLVTVHGEMVNRDSRDIAPLYRVRDIVGLKR